jgi:DNA-directed RNA polymerase specialized sigma subunit
MGERRVNHYSNIVAFHNEPLAINWVNKMRGVADINYDEYLDEAKMALVRAINLFDVDRGWKFSTYASNAIIQGLGRRQGILSRSIASPIEIIPYSGLRPWEGR